MSKGSRSRVFDTSAYAANHERIFNTEPYDNVKDDELTPKDDKPTPFDTIFDDPPSDNRKWGFALYEDSEVWSGGIAASREEVIQEAKQELGGDVPEGGSFFICRCTPISLANLLPSADSIIETMDEAAYDNYGEWSEGFLDCLDSDATRELDQLLQSWANKHQPSPATRWQADNIEEVKW